MRKDLVFSMAQVLSVELRGWRQRSLAEQRFPNPVVDACYEYVRNDGRVESEGVLTCKGINQAGYREILSVAVAPGKEEASSGAVFADLLARDLDPQAVRYVVSDEHQGPKAALRRCLPRGTWQRCQTHYQRNAGVKVPRRARQEFHRQRRDVFDAPNVSFHSTTYSYDMVLTWQIRD